MIPVQFQPEPDDFEDKVRKPGLAFLNKVPNPKSEDWKNRDYWRKSLPDLYTSYNKICAYSAQWIPRPEGSPTVDHFLPKSAKPELAYEWDNFRLASLRMNARKNDFQDVIDPCKLNLGDFILDFPVLSISASFNLSDSLKKQIMDTIDRLKLNDEICKQGRLEWLMPYCETVYPFEYLKKKAPFIAYELERQGLVDVDKIAKIMGVKI